MSKLIKEIAFGSLFLVLVFASIYFVVALPAPLTTIDVGYGGLPNASSTKVVSLSAGNNINTSNMSGTVSFMFNTSLTIVGSNISNASIYYNATVGPEQALTWTLVGHNTTFNLSTAVNGTVYIIVWDTTKVADSNQSVVINLTITGANSTNGTYTPVTSAIAYNITIDNTAPVVRLHGYAFDKAGEEFQKTHYRKNGTGIRLNFSALDTLQFLGTCRLFSDFSGTTSFVGNGSVAGATNQLNVSRGASTRITVGTDTAVGSAGNYSNTNYVNLSDGTYLWNVQCNDTLGNAGSNATNFTLIIDTTNPSSATLTVPTTDTSFGNSASISCSSVDATAGVNKTIMTVKGPGSDTTVRATIRATSGTVTTGGGKDISNLGVYKVDCDVTDKAGNGPTKASQKEFTVSSAAGGGSGGGGSGGGTGGRTYNIVLTTKGTTKLLAVADIAKFKVGGKSHSVTVKVIGADSASVTVSSVPVTLTISVGQTKRVDYENDNVYDLAVKLVSIAANKANLEFKTISEAYTGAPEGTPSEEEEEGEEAVEEEAVVEEKRSLAALWWIVGIVILAIIIAMIVSAKKKQR